MAVAFLMRSFPLRIRTPQPRLAVGLLFGQLRRPASTASAKGPAFPKPPPKVATEVLLMRLRRLFISPDNSVDLRPRRPEVDTLEKLLRSKRRQNKNLRDKITEKNILQEIKPLVLFTREILHSGRYGNGDRLDVDDEMLVMDELLPYHEDAVEKIGCGVDYIKVDIHPEYIHLNSRCLFVVRNDGGCIDFSYKMCVYGYISTKYPSLAERIITRLPRHLQRWRYCW